MPPHASRRNRATYDNCVSYRRMKTLHLDTRPDWRGGQHQILLTMRGLRHLGHDAQLLTRANSLLAQRASAENFSVHRFSTRFPRLQALLCLNEILHQQRFEIIHAHDPHALTAAWLARAHHRAALAVSRRVAYPLSRFWLGLARYRAAHRIIAVSKFVADSVISSGIDSERVAVVYDGAEIPAPFTPDERIAARHTWNISNSARLIGCVGYLLPEKGQELLLRAMKDVVSLFPDCKLLFAGDGPMRSQLQTLATALALESNVIFAGFIADTESVYRALDVFVFPSLAEPLGSSLLAAMAHGLPVAAIASGGVPEIIENGRNGMLADVPDPAKLARAICELLRNPEMASRLAASARKTISKRFTAELLAENTLREYEKALSLARRA
ncbi:MAG TPA: glycosyltransferase family 4 protein [Verrucomicrobiae bacterium]|nr:glycosyltransferase family 4 protein [Verrucomicrobiae bacterium]